MTDPYQIEGPLCVEMMQEAFARCALTATPTRIRANETTLRQVLHMIVDAYPLNKSAGTTPEGIRFYVPMFNNVLLALDETQPHGRLLFMSDVEPENQAAMCYLDITVEREYQGRTVVVEESAPRDFKG